MMKTLFTCFFILLGTCLFAQQKTYTLQRDTINLHGFIYDNTGRPLKLMHIQSAQLETEHNYFKAGAYTDASGYFEIKGAKFHDTLTVGPDIRYDLPQYYNNGSRYMVIYLPPAKITDINTEKPFEIVQKRRLPKVKPSFTVQPFSDMGTNHNVSEPAQYPGGISELGDFMTKNIVYPEKAIKNNAEGTVQVEFTVTADGKVTGCTVLKGIGFNCDDEVIRILKKAAKWTPALENDRPVAVLETLAVEFKLTDK